MDAVVGRGLAVASSVVVREQLPRALGAEDRLLLYFAGHGIALDGDAGPAGYLVPRTPGARSPTASC